MGDRETRDAAQGTVRAHVPATSTRPPEPLEITPHALATRYVGLRELPGDLHHPLIQWWLMLSGFGSNAPDEILWCGAFVEGIAWELGLGRPQFSARARHWLTAGVPLNRRDARPGFDVVILKRAGRNEPGPEVLGAPGHVGFLHGFSEERVFLLGGNQSNKVSIAPFEAARILGIRRLRKV